MPTLGIKSDKAPWRVSSSITAETTSSKIINSTAGQNALKPQPKSLSAIKKAPRKKFHS